MRTIHLDGQPQGALEEEEAHATEWPVAPPSPEELPAGSYVAAYRGDRRGRWFGQAKVELLFEIVEPLAQRGLRVSLFATLPKRGQVSSRSKYYALWLQANGGPPRRGDRMTPRVFSGYWRVRVGWSIPQKDGPGKPIVTELIERVAGGPSR